jgi:hypothetical protein
VVARDTFELAREFERQETVHAEVNADKDEVAKVETVTTDATPFTNAPYNYPMADPTQTKSQLKMTDHSIQVPVNKP